MGNLARDPKQKDLITMMYKLTNILLALILILIISCSPQDEITVPVTPVEDTSIGNHVKPETVFTLQTIADSGKLLYIGMGGEIDGIVNPDLIVEPGAVVRIILINGDGMPHDLFIPELDVKTDYVKRIGEPTEVVFEIGNMQPGTYVYYCTLPGHRKAGQEGKLVVAKP